MMSFKLRLLALAALVTVVCGVTERCEIDTHGNVDAVNTPCVCDRTSFIGSTYDCACTSGSTCLCQNAGACICGDAASCTCQNSGECYCGNAGSCTISNKGDGYCKTGAAVGSGACKEKDHDGFDLRCVANPYNQSSVGIINPEEDVCTTSILPEIIGPICAAVIIIYVMILCVCIDCHGKKNRLVETRKDARKGTGMETLRVFQNNAGCLWLSFGTVPILAGIGLFFAAIVDKGMKIWPWGFIPFTLGVLLYTCYGRSWLVMDPVLGTAAFSTNYCCCWSTLANEVSLEDITNASIEEMETENSGVTTTIYRLVINQKNDLPPLSLNAGADNVGTNKKYELCRQINQFLTQYHGPVRDGATTAGPSSTTPSAGRISVAMKVDEDSRPRAAFCHMCGKQQTALGAKFCAFCGAELPLQSAVTRPASLHSGTGKKNGKSSKRSHKKSSQEKKVSKSSSESKGSRSSSEAASPTNSA